MNKYVLNCVQSSRAINNRIDELIEVYGRSPRKDVIMKLIMEWKDKYIDKLKEEEAL